MFVLPCKLKVKDDKMMLAVHEETVYCSWLVVENMTGEFRGELCFNLEPEVQNRHLSIAATHGKFYQDQNLKISTV